MSGISGAGTAVMVPERFLLLAMLPIGDSLFAEPTVRALRIRYPRSQIIAYTRSGAAPVWRSMAAVDEVRVLPTGADWAGFGALARTLAETRARRFDVAIDFTSPAYKWISMFAGIPCRTYMKFDRLWWLVPRRHDRWRATHAARHYYDCALELDLPDWNSFDHTPHLDLPESAYAKASAFLQSRGIGVHRSLVAVHPGGAGLARLKRWPAASFAATADRLVDEMDAQIIVVGGRAERSLAHDVSGHMRHSAVVAAGELPLLASFALLAACDLFIGNDSSLLHAAAALGTAYVGVMGPTSPASFRPLARRSGQGRVVLPNPPCIEMSSFVGSSVIWDRPECSQFCAALAALPPDRVIRAALEQLQVSRGLLTPVT